MQTRRASTNMDSGTTAALLRCGIAGAIGVRRLLHPGRGGTWGPFLLIGYGLGLIGAGVFVADPAHGFPPGAPMESSELSRSGLPHFVSGGIGFCSLIAACFVFARRFAGLGCRGWAGYSAFTGVAFFGSFAAISSGSTATVTMLAFCVAIAWVWVWHSALSTTLLRESRTMLRYATEKLGEEQREHYRAVSRTG